MAKPQNTSWRNWWWVLLLEWLWNLVRELFKPQPPPLPPPSPSPPPDNNGRTDMSLEFIQNNAEAYYTASSGTAGDQEFVDQLGNHAALQRGSTTSTDANDPRYVKESEAFLFFPGSTGNYAAVPDEAALDITGDIDVRVKVALPDYTPPATDDLFSKWNTSGGRSWLFRIANARLEFWWSEDGAVAKSENSAAAVPTTDGDTIWLRATLDVDNGSSQNNVRFYTSEDGSSWSQLGADQISGGTSSVFASTTEVAIGTYNSGSAASALLGNVFRAQVYDGIAGTKVLDIDVETDNTTASQTSFTATTGQTVTLNRSSTGNKLIYVPADVGVWQSDGTDDYLQLPATLAPTFTATTGEYTVLVCMRYFGTAVNTRLFSSEGSNDQSLIVYNMASIRAFVGGGSGTAFDTNGTTAANTIMVVGGKVDDGTVEVYNSNNGGLSGSASDITGVGTISHGAPRLAIKANSTGNPWPGDIFSVVIFESAPSSANLDLVSDYLIAQAEGTVFTPSTIAATATLPAPTASELTTVQPAAIAATTTLPSPTIVLPSTNAVTLTIRDTGHTATAREQT